MFSAADERFPRDHPQGTPAGPSTAEGRTTWVASLNHVYLLGTEVAPRQGSSEASLGTKLPTVVLFC